MIEVKGAPKIKGLSFRRFRDKEDFARMVAVSQRSWLADGFEWLQTEEDIAISYKGREDRSLDDDLIMIEADGEVVGYGEIFTETIDKKSKIYWNSVHLLPEWRCRGLRETVFDFNERENLCRAKEGSYMGYLQAWANESPNDWRTIVLSKGFTPSWHILEMVRPNLDNIPDFPLPDGLEVRKVTERDYPQIWAGMKQAFRDEPWYTEWRFDDAHFRQWVESPDLDSDLWQVAWDGDKVVGTVQNFVKKAENEAFARSRGHTERIFVSRSWQRKGVARALISRSLKMLRDMGLQDATLDVNAENVSGALDLYQKMGYLPTYHFTFFRKQLRP